MIFRCIIAADDFKWNGAFLFENCLKGFFDERLIVAGTDQYADQSVHNKHPVISGHMGEGFQSGGFRIEDIENPADSGDIEDDFRTGLKTAQLDGPCLVVLVLLDRYQCAESGRIHIYHFLQIQQDPLVLFHTLEHHIFELFGTVRCQMTRKRDFQNVSDIFEMIFHNAVVNSAPVVLPKVMFYPAPYVFQSKTLIKIRNPSGSLSFYLSAETQYSTGSFEIKNPKFFFV